MWGPRGAETLNLQSAEGSIRRGGRSTFNGEQGRPTAVKEAEKSSDIGGQRIPASFAHVVLVMEFHGSGS
jgi:hypothetical protein